MARGAPEHAQQLPDCRRTPDEPLDRLSDTRAEPRVLHGEPPPVDREALALLELPQGEDDLVREFLAPLADGFPGELGLKDDCAVLAVAPGTELVLKTDPVVAGVHFFADDDPADIAWKALAVNVSDLAAKGVVSSEQDVRRAMNVLMEKAIAEIKATG